MVRSKGTQTQKEEIDSKVGSVNPPLQKNPHATIEQALMELLDYAIIMLDNSGNILSWNTGAEKIKGYKASEIVGKNYRIFYSLEDKNDLLPERLLAQARAEGRANYEGWRIRKDGTRFWGGMTMTALHDDKGDVRGFLKVTRDLTEKKIAEDNHNTFVEELKMKNEALRQSEERYHKMVSEVVEYAIILLDPDGKVLDWNKGAEQVKGYRADEIIGKSFRLFYPLEEKEARLPERLLEAARTHGSTRHEGWRVKKDGSRFWGFITITALRDDQNNLIGFSKVTRDLTERKINEDRVNNMFEELRQVNAQLRESEERYHKMIAEVQDYAIILLNTSGQIQNWNVGAQVIKGYQAKEVIGKHFSIFYAKEDKESNLPDRLINEAVQRGKATHEGWRIRKDGSRFWGSVVITALHNSLGNLIGFSKVTRDLTERKLAEDALKASAAQLDLKNKTLERLNEELSSFTHVASHDLKEPLRKIQTFASRIEYEGFNPEQSKLFLEKIKSSAHQMQNLMDDLLAYSQVSNEAGIFESIDLNDILGGVKNDLEVAIHDKHATITADRLPVVSGLRHQLHQLFLNLISNAIKFSRPDVPPAITIKLQTIQGPDLPAVAKGKSKYHHISIADNGIGFEPQFNSKIFEAFHRLNSKYAYQGTGIGLAIVKKVVENHNGVVSAEGRPGEGATFNIYLPARN